MFTELPIQQGQGKLIHMNRFRVRIKPRRGYTLPDAEAITYLMEKFMDPRTATVKANDPSWNGLPTLIFRGVPRLLPFVVLPSITISFPVPIVIPIPDKVRTMPFPRVHTDAVALTGISDDTPDLKGFTVQTLKREFETADDLELRTLIGRTVVPPLIAAGMLISPIVGAGVALASSAIAQAAGDAAVWRNQHHFLSGRRSFYLGTAKGFGLPGDDWYFETAAVERFSLPDFEKMTDFAMGGAEAVTTPVWLQMTAKVAEFYGEQVGQTDYWTAAFGTVHEARDSARFKSLWPVGRLLIPR